MEQQPATTPQDVAPEQGQSTDSQSFDDKILAKFGLGEPESQPDESQPQPQGEEEAASEEEVESADESQSEQLFELKYNHETKRVPVSEAQRLAQQGMDYETKMGRLKDDFQRMQGMAAAIQAQATLSPQYVDALADVRSIDKQLQHYANVDWASLAQADPIGASQQHMAYQQLRDLRANAAQKAEQLRGQLGQTSQFVDQQTLAIEGQRLMEKFPEWKDAERFNKDSKAIAQNAMKSYGFTPQELQQSPLLSDHRVISLLRDAWKYREATNTKANKGLPQGLPAVAKPGAKPAPRSGKQQLGDIKRGLRQVQSPEARKALEDELIAQKFGLK